MNRLKKISRAVTIGMLALPTLLQAQEHREQVASMETAIREVVDSFHTALAEGDTTKVLGLLAVDAQILEGGGIETAEEYAAGHLSADMAFAQAVPRERGELSVRMMGGVAWVTTTSRATGMYRGREVDSRGGELMVLSRSEDGEWKIRAISWS